MLHSQGVFASFGIGVENQCGAILEAKTGKAPVLGVVKGPGSALPPVTVASSPVDGAPTCVVNGAFELPPGEKEVRLVVDAELPFDRVARRAGSGVAEIIKEVVDLGVRGRDGGEVLH